MVLIDDLCWATNIFIDTFFHIFVDSNKYLFTIHSFTYYLHPSIRPSIHVFICWCSISAVKQMAKDWISGNWYFTDDSMAAIFMCDQTGVHCIILITTNLKGPVAIAVDPAEG